MGPEVIAVTPRPQNHIVPLTECQLLMWNLGMKQGTLPSDQRKCALSARVLGSFDEALLQQSIAAVAQRHESLRTTVVSEGGIPRQRIDTQYRHSLEVMDLRKLPAASVEAEVVRLADEFLGRQIDVAVGPLFAARLLRLADDECVLVVGVDHIVSDAISCALLSKEILVCYHDAARGHPCSLPPLSLQFADYAVWQQETYDAWLRAHGEYWRERLDGAPQLEFLADTGTTPVEDPPLALLHVPFGKALSTRLQELTGREQLMLPIVVLAIYVVELAHWSGANDFLLWFLSHGRHHAPELKSMIGFLAYPLPMRIEISQQDSFLQLTRRLMTEFHASRAHQSCARPLDFLPQAATDASFNWIPRGSVQQQVPTPREYGIRPFPIQRSRMAVARCKFAATFADTAAGVVGTLWYRPDLFATSTIEMFARNLRRLAEHCALQPAAHVTEK